MKNETVAKKKVDVSSFALYIGAVLILICFTIVCKIAGKDFLTLRNIQNIISQSSCVAVVAIGASLVILTGGIDLSAGSVIGFVGIFAALFIKNGVPIAVAFLIGLAAGALIGLVNGVIISCGKVPAFIATLGTMNIARGLAYLTNGGKSITGLPVLLANIMGTKLFGSMPISILYVIVLYALIFFVMTYTRFGRRVYALGGNVKAAKLSGVKVKQLEVGVYVLAGVFSAIAGLMLLSRLFVADPNTGSGYEMDAIASCVIGGISLSGGKGKVLNTFVGALILGMLTCGLQILNISVHWQTIISGLVIVGAVYMDKSKERKAE